MSSTPNLPMDFREMEILRFFFELNQQQMDPAKLQQILLQHQIQSQLKPLSHQTFSPIFKPKHENISTPARVVIPEPKIVFQYVPSPKFPTPTSTPEPKLISSDEEESDDYKKMQRKSKEFHFEDRCNFINLNDERNRKLLMTPTSIAHESDRDSDHEHTESNLSKLVLQEKIKTWPTSIYHNLPDIVMGEFDKILRESHDIKHVVVDKLNHAFPVNYEYNPKKSRIRTNYCDPQIADDRTRNNIASRRSRQRKKFLTHVHQYSVDYDEDENTLLKMQEKWLRAIITGLEKKIIEKPEREEELFRLRKQCGFN